MSNTRSMGLWLIAGRPDMTWPGFCCAAWARIGGAWNECSPNRPIRPSARRRFRGRRIPPPLALPGGLSPAHCPRRVRHRDAPGTRPGACHGTGHSRHRLDERVVQEHCPAPARRGRSPYPDCVLVPWTVFLILVLVPWLIVRRSRRQRVEKVEQDLPISLELLATLSEAGLGFDAALSRVLDSVMEDRPLAREFRTYQSDLLAGRSAWKPCGDWPAAWRSHP